MLLSQRGDVTHPGSDRLLRIHSLKLLSVEGKRKGKVQLIVVIMSRTPYNASLTSVKGFQKNNTLSFAHCPNLAAHNDLTLLFLGRKNNVKKLAKLHVGGGHSWKKAEKSNTDKNSRKERAQRH